MKEMLVRHSDTFFGIAAKSDKSNPANWLPLWMHLSDTVSVMNDLLNRRFDLSMLSELDKEELRRICLFLAATHDLGKATPAFQDMISESGDQLAAQLNSQGLISEKKYTLDERQKYGRHDMNGALLLMNCGLCREVAVVIAAHHGSIPEKDYSDEDTSNYAQYPGLFQGKDSQKKWQNVQKEFIDFALRTAGYSSLEEITPIRKDLQMLAAGLLITADWLASNTAYFPLVAISAEPDELMKLYPKRTEEGCNKIQFPGKWEVSERWKKGDLLNQIYHFSANEMQKKVQEIAATIEHPGLMIIEAPMGNGKTEAALAAAEILASRMGKCGLAFFLPSQATSNAIFTRLQQWAETQVSGHSLSMQLAHASFLLNSDFEQIFRRSGEEQGEPDLIAHQFFCGSKSYLLANFVAGTIDQLLMAAIKQKHVMLKHLGLSEKVVIIDECHAYDAYMNTYLDRILDYLQLYHVPVILLSATLPAKRRIELLKAYGSRQKKSDVSMISKEEGYPLISWTDGEQISYFASDPCNAQNRVQVHRITDDDVFSIVNKAVTDSACIGIIVNTVSRAQWFFEALKSIENANTLLYHAQYIFTDRTEKESQILQLVGKHSDAEQRKGMVIIGTQVLEQSLDIDFDVLITDHCPMDLLLQRIGRLHRHCGRKRPSGYEIPRCCILNTDCDNLEKGAEAIYGSYLLKKTSLLLPDSIELPSDISPLVQSVYDETDDKLRTEGKLEAEYQEYCSKNEKLNRSAQSFLMKMISIGQKQFSCSTIEGLLSKSEAITEESARASVRAGDPSIEVLVIKEVDSATYEFLSGNARGVRISAESFPDENTARELAKQKLRLPHRLSNQWNGPKVSEALRRETDERLGHFMKSPWLRNELFLILDKDANKILLDRYVLHYSIEEGLVIQEEVE